MMESEWKSVYHKYLPDHSLYLQINDDTSLDDNFRVMDNYTNQYFNNIRQAEIHYQRLINRYTSNAIMGVR